MNHEAHKEHEGHEGIEALARSIAGSGFAFVRFVIYCGFAASSDSGGKALAR